MKTTSKEVTITASINEDIGEKSIESILPKVAVPSLSGKPFRSL